MTEQTILLVDDEPTNLRLLDQILEPSYDLLFARNGREALEVAGEEKPDLILLDIQMPEVDGWEVLEQLKTNMELQGIPIIMQTSLDTPEDFARGMELGAYYYLTKPVKREKLLPIIQAALEESVRMKRLQTELQAEIGKTDTALMLMGESRFYFRTLDQVQPLSVLAGRICPNPNRHALGLSELLLNAIEHGNLGITYDEKSSLNESRTWKDEVERRLALPENLNKFAMLEFLRSDKEIIFHVRDQGSGFDWRKYLEVSTERLFDNHGRGVTVGNHSFDDLRYEGQGNVAVATIFLP